MARKTDNKSVIHQTGTRQAWVFQHDHWPHDNPLVLLPTNREGEWYVIREYGHNLVNPIGVMTDEEILQNFGFDVNAWTDADNRPFP